MDTEIYFLISKFLALGPCQRAADALKAEIELHRLMPKRLDWQGKEHDRTLADVERTNPHIRQDHLLKICSRIGGILDKEVTPSIAGVTSILGDGKQSLLRSLSDPPRKPTIRALTARIHGAPVFPAAGQVANYPFNLGMFLSRNETLKMHDLTFCF